MTKESAFDIINSLIDEELNRKKKSIMHKWEESNADLSSLFVESCELAIERNIPFTKVVDKFKTEFNAPPGSYSTIKRFVNERIGEKEA